jgi:hypothetical protein
MSPVIHRGVRADTHRKLAIAGHRAEARVLGPSGYSGWYGGVAQLTAARAILHTHIGAGGGAGSLNKYRGGKALARRLTGNRLVHGDGKAAGGTVYVQHVRLTVKTRAAGEIGVGGGATANGNIPAAQTTRRPRGIGQQIPRLTEDLHLVDEGRVIAGVQAVECNRVAAAGRCE